MKFAMRKAEKASYLLTFIDNIRLDLRHICNKNKRSLQATPEAASRKPWGFDCGVPCCLEIGV